MSSPYYSDFPLSPQLHTVRSSGGTVSDPDVSTQWSMRSPGGGGGADEDSNEWPATVPFDGISSAIPKSTPIQTQHQFDKSSIHPTEHSHAHKHHHHHHHPHSSHHASKPVTTYPDGSEDPDSNEDFTQWTHFGGRDDDSPIAASKSQKQPTTFPDDATVDASLMDPSIYSFSSALSDTDGAGEHDVSFIPPRTITLPQPSATAALAASRKRSEYFERNLAAQEALRKKNKKLTPLSAEELECKQYRVRMLEKKIADIRARYAEKKNRVAQSFQQVREGYEKFRARNQQVVAQGMEVIEKIEQVQLQLHEDDLEEAEKELSSAMTLHDTKLATNLASLPPVVLGPNPQTTMRGFVHEDLPMQLLTKQPNAAVRTIPAERRSKMVEVGGHVLQASPTNTGTGQRLPTSPLSSSPVANQKMTLIQQLATSPSPSHSSVSLIPVTSNTNAQLVSATTGIPQLSDQPLPPPVKLLECLAEHAAECMEKGEKIDRNTYALLHNATKFSELQQEKRSKKQVQRRGELGVPVAASPERHKEWVDKYVLHSPPEKPHAHTFLAPEYDTHDGQSLTSKLTPFQLLQLEKKRFLTYQSLMKDVWSKNSQEKQTEAIIQVNDAIKATNLERSKSRIRFEQEKVLSMELLEKKKALLELKDIESSEAAARHEYRRRAENVFRLLEKDSLWRSDHGQQAKEMLAQMAQQPQQINTYWNQPVVHGGSGPSQPIAPSIPSAIPHSQQQPSNLDKHHLYEAMQAASTRPLSNLRSHGWRDDLWEQKEWSHHDDSSLGSQPSTQPSTYRTTGSLPSTNRSGRWSPIPDQQSPVAKPIPFTAPPPLAPYPATLRSPAAARYAPDAEYNISESEDDPNHPDPSPTTIRRARRRLQAAERDAKLAAALKAAERKTQQERAERRAREERADWEWEQARKARLQREKEEEEQRSLGIAVAPPSSSSTASSPINKKNVSFHQSGRGGDSDRSPPSSARKSPRTPASSIQQVYDEKKQQQDQQHRLTLDIDLQQQRQDHERATLKGEVEARMQAKYIEDHINSMLERSKEVRREEELRKSQQQQFSTLSVPGTGAITSRGHIHHRENDPVIYESQPSSPHFTASTNRAAIAEHHATLGRRADDHFDPESDRKHNDLSYSFSRSQLGGPLHSPSSQHGGHVEIEDEMLSHSTLISPKKKVEKITTMTTTTATISSGSTLVRDGANIAAGAAANVSASTIPHHDASSSSFNSSDYGSDLSSLGSTSINLSQPTPLPKSPNPLVVETNPPPPLTDDQLALQARDANRAALAPTSPFRGPMTRISSSNSAAALATVAATTVTSSNVQSPPTLLTSESPKSLPISQPLSSGSPSSKRAKSVKSSPIGGTVIPSASPPALPLSRPTQSPTHLPTRPQSSVHSPQLRSSDDLTTSSEFAELYASVDDLGEINSPAAGERSQRQQPIRGEQSDIKSADEQEPGHGMGIEIPVPTASRDLSPGGGHGHGTQSLRSSMDYDVSNVEGDFENFHVAQPDFYHTTTKPNTRTS